MSKPIEWKIALVQQLQSLRLSGMDVLPAPRRAPAPAPEPAEPSVMEAVTGGELAVGEPASAARPQPQLLGPAPAVAKGLFDEADQVVSPPAMSRDERVRALSVLQREVTGCTRCADLVRSRTRTVFGVGNPQPRVCFFGEGPGADEDAQGEPFVGRAGLLLNKIITASKMTREEVYILNAIKCRPENNRTPTDEEIENCWGFTRRQLDILQPEFICCLGGVAVRSLLKRKDSVGRLRQQFFRYGRSQVMVTYHPAYLLRNPAAKREVWEDMQMLMQALGIPLL